MIEVQGLMHRYGPLIAVHELSFTVERGEVLGLLGPNGAGKTTALRAVVGLLSPTRGRIRIGGRPLDQGTAARAALGFLPEHTPLYRELTVEEFLRFVSRAKGVPAAQERDEIDRVVDLCELKPVRRRLIGYCSRGYRQRVGLAQALVADPPALVLDEPTVGLDPAQVVGLRDRIADLSRDKAVILSTHVLPEAQRLCTRVLILDRGRRLAEDRPEALAAAIGETSRVRLHATPVENVATVLASHPGVLSLVDLGNGQWRLELSDGTRPAKIVRALVEAGCDVDTCAPERLELEDVFLRLVRREDEGGAG